MLQVPFWRYFKNKMHKKRFHTQNIKKVIFIDYLTVLIFCNGSPLGSLEVQVKKNVSMRKKRENSSDDTSIQLVSQFQKFMRDHS
jgi:hypothetical protein